MNAPKSTVDLKSSPNSFPMSIERERMTANVDSTNNPSENVEESPSLATQQQRDQWEEFQIDHAKRVITTDVVDINSIVLVGGLDISFDKDDDNRGCAFITVYDITKGVVVHEEYSVVQLTVPYISGYLGFREVALYIPLLERLRGTPFYPQLLMVDGCGILHPRGFGSATHIGVLLDIPSIGVGKTLLYIDGLDEMVIKAHFRASCRAKGDFVPLTGLSGTIYGVALKSTATTTNPIYVSVGHKISLASAVALVTRTCIYRIPEPIRNSDIKSKPPLLL